MLTLFSTKNRTAPTSHNYSDSIWQRWNRSVHPDMVQARQTLEAWFVHVPEATTLDVQRKTDLRNRFRNKDTYQHVSAFYDLYIHELLRRLGFTVERDPVVGNSKHPDFKVFRDGNPCFYLEVTVPRPRDAPEDGETARLNLLWDRLNALHSPRCCFWITHEGQIVEDSAIKRLSLHVEKWLNGLTEDDVAKDEEWDESSPSVLRVEEGGLHLTLLPVRRFDGGTGRHSNIRGMGPSGSSSIDTFSSIRSAIDKKANKYGDLDLPYIIAVNVRDTFVNPDHTFDALFGTEYDLFYPSLEGPTRRETRRRKDGAWIDGQGPRRTQVSGLLISFQMTVWKVAEELPMLIHHPYPLHPLPSDLLPIEQLVFDKNIGHYEEVSGTPASVVFG